VGVPTVTCDTTECVENVVDHASELSARFGHDSCPQQVSIAASDVADCSVNLLQTANKSECSEKNKSTLNDILCKKEYQVKVELLESNSIPCQEQEDGYDLITSNTDNTIHCSRNNAVSPPTAECLPSNARDSVSVYEQQQKVLLKKGKQSKTQSTDTGMSLIFEQQNDDHVCSESVGLSTIGHKECGAAAVHLQGTGKLLFLNTFVVLNVFFYLF